MFPQACFYIFVLFAMPVRARIMENIMRVAAKLMPTSCQNYTEPVPENLIMTSTVCHILLGTKLPGTWYHRGPGTTCLASRSQTLSLLCVYRTSAQALRKLCLPASLIAFVEQHHGTQEAERRYTGLSFCNADHDLTCL